MFSRVEFKLEAKDKLRGNWSYIAGLTIISFILIIISTFILEWIPFIGMILSLFVTAPLQFSLLVIAKKLYYGEDIPVNDVFSGFQLLMKVVGLTLWTALWTYLWTLLFIIPGIIKSYSYSMANYCLLNNPELSVREALKESIRITNGYKGNLFILDLSFIGWSLLAVFTCGLGMVFLLPYMYLTKYIAFRFLKEKADGYVNEIDQPYEDVEASTAAQSEESRQDSMNDTFVEDSSKAENTMDDAVSTCENNNEEISSANDESADL